MAQKNALSVQSLACHGKCSLTEALPIVSAEGISLSVLPTVVLSTHTGGFGIPERLETADFFKKTLNHFTNEKITFNGIHTGYFAETNQISIFLEKLDDLKKEDTFLLVDPVLGDNGKLFKGITEDFIGTMLSLCKRADVITPNITEAYLLCKEKYCQTLDTDVIMGLSLKLYDMTRAKVIITGIEIENKIGVSIFDGEKIKFIFIKKQKQSFHGTGDIFASIVFTGILNDMPLVKAVKKATVFISKAINKTDTPERDGLEFESLIKKG